MPAPQVHNARHDRPARRWLCRDALQHATLPFLLRSAQLALAAAAAIGCSNVRVADASGNSSQRIAEASAIAPVASSLAESAGAAGSATIVPDASIEVDASYAGRTVARAILVSVDGLGARHLTQPLASGTFRGFAALMQAGSSTLNARADYELTLTLPNHTSMLTGRPVARDPKLPPNTHHGWIANWVVEPNTTLHNSGNRALSYVSSIFDVAHDHGKKTCMYASKQKFAVYSNSYDVTHGAPDVTGEDNGRNKLDRVVILEDRTEQLISIAEADISGGLCDLAFIHITDLDTPIGHGMGWGSNAWYTGLKHVDDWIGRLLRLALRGDSNMKLGLVVTADHGGTENDHNNSADLWNNQIPFFAVGPGFPPNSDLYSICGNSRQDPGTERPRYAAPRQPIRNADAANVLMTMLGLPLVPGSFMRDLLPPK